MTNKQLLDLKYKVYKALDSSNPRDQIEKIFDDAISSNIYNGAGVRSPSEWVPPPKFGDTGIYFDTHKGSSNDT